MRLNTARPIQPWNRSCSQFGIEPEFPRLPPRQPPSDQEPSKNPMENEHFQAPTPPTEPVDLQSKIEALHQLVTSVLLLLVVVSGTLWVFLMRQVKSTGTDLATYRA